MISHPFKGRIPCVLRRSVSQRRRWLGRLGSLALGVAATVGGVGGAIAAETIYFSVGPLLQSVEVETLETFANSGEITGDLRRYAPFVSAAQLEQLRILLTRPYRMDPVLVGSLTYSPLGSNFLEQLGDIFQTPSGSNGFHAIRSALIQTAQSPEGFTILGFLQNFPTDMRINIRQALQLGQAFAQFNEERRLALRAIAQQAEADTASAPLEPAIDLTAPGPLRTTRQSLSLEGTGTQALTADLYLPTVEAAAPLPVVVLAPDISDTAGDLTPLAPFLASHGIAVIQPMYPDTGQTLENQLRSADFVTRPTDITATLNALQAWAANQPNPALNLEAVGLIGYGFGGYVGFTLAGAEPSETLLAPTCNRERFLLNLSELIQCRARFPENLPSLQDPRIQAVISIDPYSSLLISPERLADIAVPTLVASTGSSLIAPPVPEQVKPFTDLTTPDRYLLVKAPQPASTVEAEADGANPMLLDLLTQPPQERIEPYLKAISLAFVQTYIGQAPDYAAYLNSAFAQQISPEDSRIYLIRSLDPGLHAHP